MYFFHFGQIDERVIEAHCFHCGERTYSGIMNHWGVTFCDSCAMGFVACAWQRASANMPPSLYGASGRKARVA